MDCSIMIFLDIDQAFLALPGVMLAKSLTNLTEMLKMAHRGQSSQKEVGR